MCDLIFDSRCICYIAPVLLELIKSDIEDINATIEMVY